MYASIIQIGSPMKEKRQLLPHPLHFFQVDFRA